MSFNFWLAELGLNPFDFVRLKRIEISSIKLVQSSKDETSGRLTEWRM